MANKYVSSVDGNNGTPPSVSWWNGSQPTYATLAGAAAASAAGDTIYVDHAHAETQASAMSIFIPGTAASPVRVICVNRTTGAAATTATVSTTGANGLNIAATNACFYVYGITFSSGSYISSQHTSSGSGRIIYESCNFILNNASGSSVVQYGAGSGTCECFFRNSSVTFGHADQSIQSWIGFLTWDQGSISGTAPTQLFTGIYSFHVTCRGVDLSLLGSGKSLVVQGNYSYDGSCRIINCKLGSSVALVTGTASSRFNTWLINGDSADTNYRYQYTGYEGSIYSESTIVRTGGASDGTTPISRKMVSSADPEYFYPLKSDPILVWNETTGSSVTLTVETVTDNVTLTDAEAWIEVEYLGTSGFPKSSFIRDRSTDIVSTPANQTSSSETWTTTGLTTPVKQKLSVSVTPQEKGLFRVRVCLAKPSTTMYFCPKVDLT